MKKKFLVLSAILLMAFVLQAQTVSTTAAAKIVSAISIAKTADLHFGTMVAGNTVSTVTLPASGSRTSTGTVILLTQTPISQASNYTVTGDAYSTYGITLPTILISVSNGSNSMTVNGFVSSKISPINVGEIQFGGTDTFTIGATLNMIASQPSGSYTGTFDVTVAYN